MLIICKERMVKQTFLIRHVKEGPETLSRQVKEEGSLLSTTGSGLSYREERKYRTLFPTRSTPRNCYYCCFVNEGGRKRRKAG
jgi:hypothetical protein